MPSLSVLPEASDIKHYEMSPTTRILVAIIARRDRRLVPRRRCSSADRVRLRRT